MTKTIHASWRVLNSNIQIQNRLSKVNCSICWTQKTGFDLCNSTRYSANSIAACTIYGSHSQSSPETTVASWRNNTEGHWKKSPSAVITIRREAGMEKWEWTSAKQWFSTVSQEIRWFKHEIGGKKVVRVRCPYRPFLPWHCPVPKKMSSGAGNWLSHSVTHTHTHTRLLR